MEPFNIRIKQGKTYERTVRWETQPLVYVPITAIAQVAPVLITAPAHGLTDGWDVAIRDVVGMYQINAPSGLPLGVDRKRVTIVSTDQIELNAVSAGSYSAYVSGGYVMFYTPTPMAGMRARMDIKDRVGGTVLYSLFTDDEPGSGTGLIVIDDTAKTVVFTIPAIDSELFTWRRGVYELEMVSASDVVTTILYGSVQVKREVTTDE